MRITRNAAACASQTVRGASPNALGWCLALAAGGLAVAMPSSAFAQVGPDAESQDGTIIVTAQKRNERLNEVPVSISVVSGETLSETHATSIEDITRSVPNLKFTSTVGPNTPIFALRGVSMSDYSLN